MYVSIFFLYKPIHLNNLVVRGQNTHLEIGFEKYDETTRANTLC